MKAKPSPNDFRPGKALTYENTHSADFSLLMANKSVDRLAISGGGTPIQLVPKIKTRGSIEEGKKKFNSV